MKQFQGKPIGYKITFHPVELGIDVNHVSVNYRTNSTTLTNLTAYTIYVIRVSAVSSGGIGPANTVKARTDSDGTVESIILYGSKIFSQNPDITKQCCVRKFSYIYKPLESLVY